MFKKKLYKLLIKWSQKRISFYNNLIEELYKIKFFDEFKVRKSDTYIVTFFKSGTTWMQMILYQMLNSGEDSFNHIYDVSPWLTNYAISGNSASDIEELSSPRVFKSHDNYGDFDVLLENKYVFVYRNVFDVFISMYHHDKNYNKANISLDEVYNLYFNDKLPFNYFNYLKTWLENKNNLDIHFVRYEDLKTNFDDELTKLANFFELELSINHRFKIKEKSSFVYMKANEKKFGEQPKDKRIYNNFIRKGKMGEGNILPQPLKTKLDSLSKKYLGSN